MATHQDAVKRHRQSLRRRARNRHYRSMMRNQVQRVRNAVDAGDQGQAQTEFRKAQSIVHRVARKGIIHRNQAARRISRMNALIKKTFAS